MKRPALLVLVAAAALSCSSLAPSYAGSTALSGPPGPTLLAAPTVDRATCEEQVFPTPVPADSAAARRAGVAQVGDRTRWLDTCGEVYYRESRRVGPHAAPTAEAGTAVPAAAGVLGLSSRPSSNRTIYLDFTGHRTAGTAWNRDFGVNAFTSPPFQVDGPTSTAFTPVEKEQIRRAWETVAEDYAPFDVNVTTKDPGQAAITRSSASDRRFGTRVVVTAGGPLYNSCACGGIAYLGTFDLAGSQSPVYQPTFVFTNGSTNQGWLFAENVSHEAGHNLGLAHDGRTGEEYYFGSRRWAPIMGAGFNKLSHFSRGEYDGASNKENDLAVMTRHGIAARRDDHGDAAGGATALPGTDARRTAGGVISTAVDKDVFSFTPTADGPRTIAIDPTGGATNLDVQLTVLDSAGTVLARVDPAPSGDATRPSPDWLRARWTGDLRAGRRYTVQVDGVGYGNPRTEGWSGYGSLGAYRVAVTAG